MKDLPVELTHRQPQDGKESAHTLQKRTEHLAPRLKQWVARYNLEEPLQTLASLLNNIVREAICKDLYESGELQLLPGVKMAHFARQRRDIDTRRFSLKDISEDLEFRISPPDDRMSKLECGNIGLDLQLGPHRAERQIHKVPHSA